MLQTFLKFMVDWGIWDILALVISLFPAIWIFIYIFPRRQIKNLYINTSLGSANPPYNKVVRFDITNHTNIPIYICSEGFIFGSKIKPSPSGSKDATTNTYEIKFEGRVTGIFTEIDTLIRPNQTVQTWIPIDNGETDQNINEALNTKSLGKLRLRALKIDKGRDNFVSLNIKI